MPEPTDEILEFQCPKCARRLKAQGRIAGRKVKCPKCGQPVKVPGPAAVKEPAGDDWLSLESPAIEDILARERAAAEVKAKQAAVRKSQHHLRDRQPLDSEDVKPVPTVVPRSRRQNAEAAFGNSAEIVDDEFTLEPLSQRGASESGTVTPNASPQSRAPKHPGDIESQKSVFDDDLPELAELAQPTAPRPLSRLGAPLGMEELDSLIPDLEGVPPPKRREPGRAEQGSPRSPLEEADATDHEYRIECKVCGTAQYVRQSTKGMKIKCPDCLSDFRVPPPPPGWMPKEKRKKLELSNEDVPLAAAEELHEERAIEAHRTRANAILEKAKREMSDEDIDRLYDGDFDTAGFMQRTFGFVKDPVAISFILGYGVVFACTFGIAQFGLNSADSGFGRGALLLGVVGAPLICILFGLPMLSSALALLESVANRQPRVADWPGFNMFDNFGDLLAIAVALVGAGLPGFMLGTWIGGDDHGAGRLQICGLMLTTYLFFPIFLLSILDNGSLFQPVSESVISSFKPAAEAWGGYYLKTLIAFALTVLLWFLLLGEDKSPFLAAAGGFIVPALVFFTFQQIGALADSIGEHLSFEFSPSGSEDEAAAD